jgi:hypothetical protein
MQTKFKLIVLFILAIFLAPSCNKGPKVIKSSTNNTNSEKSSGIFSEESTNESSTKNGSSFTDNLHKVVVNEILPTTRYVYLNVNEGEKQFWIATRKQDIIKGQTYFYRGGLLKTNFESKEYNRIFETVYLVTNLVKENHSNSNGTLTNANSKPSKNIAPVKESIPMHTDKIIEHKGSIKIAELVKDPEKYAGKTIQISGECVKINPGIMERNWIHLKDGTKNDFDLVVTSDTFVPEGSIITVKALVSLNKDFGAGYTYDLILENGTITQH